MGVDRALAAVPLGLGPAESAPESRWRMRGPSCGQRGAILCSSAAFHPTVILSMPDAGTESQDMNDREDVHGLGVSVVLLRQAQDGDSEAMDALCRRYYPTLLRWLSGRIPNGADGLLATSDLVQEAMVRFLGRKDVLEIRHDGAILGYLRMITANLLRDAARRGKARPQLVELEGSRQEPIGENPETPIEKAMSVKTLERYESALEELTEQERLGLILKLEFGFAPGELADALGKPTPDAARMFVDRARRKLARRMAGVDPQ